MKMGIRFLIVLLFVIGMIAVSTPSIAKANGSPTTTTTLASGDWSTGSPADVNFTDNPAPNWMQLLTSPVVVNEASQICHDFRGGQFGWVGEIRQLVDGEWVKVPVTIGWVPNTEGAFMICADVSSAGTYALFGFYNPPLSYYPDYVDPGNAPPTEVTNSSSELNF